MHSSIVTKHDSTSATPSHPGREVFVQNRETQLLLRDSKTWTPEKSEARNFRTTIDAIAFCCLSEVKNAHVLVTFNFPNVPDVVVPLEQPSGARAS